MGYFELQKRLARIDLVNLTADAMEDHRLSAVQQNREQLLEGKGADGNSLPRYRDDPYFKGNEKRITAYEKFKAKVTPNSPYGIINGFINGYMHGFITLQVVGQGYRLHAEGVAWGKDFQTKTRNQAFGLNQESREELWNKVLGKSVKQKFYETLLK